MYLPIFLTISLGCGFQLIQAMEEKNAMVHIDTKDKITRFVGKIVAYQSAPHYYASQEGNPINDNKKIHYGYVKKNNKDETKLHYLSVFDYSLLELTPLTEKKNNSKLPIFFPYVENFLLSSAQLYIREAIPEEIEVITQAIKNNTIIFERLDIFTQTKIFNDLKKIN